MIVGEDIFCVAIHAGSEQSYVDYRTGFESNAYEENAALLTHRLGDHAVCSVDIDPTLAAAAHQLLDQLDYRRETTYPRVQGRFLP